MGGRLFPIVLASLLPGLFWLWYFNRFDILEKEPLGNLSFCVLAGAAAVLPALVWEAPFSSLLQTSNSPGIQFVLSFLVVGLGEELFKLLAVLLTVFRSSEFNEPMDGIIYATAAGIGFSMVENILYISAFGMAVAPLRGTVSTLAHIAFSGIAGYYLGLAKFSPEPQSKIVQGLLAAAFFHGGYDFLLITRLASPFVLTAIVLALQILLLAAIRRAIKLSPFR